MSEKIAIAADHAGFHLKTLLVAYLKAKGFDILDLGTHSEERVDYPDYGYAMAEEIKKGAVKRGIAICGSGIGISIALNRYAEVRAALCHDMNTAQLARAHNDANVLALGSRIINEETAVACLDAFLSTPFEGGRHGGRVDKLGICGIK